MTDAAPNPEHQRIDRIEGTIEKLAQTQVEDRGRLTRIESMIETLGSVQTATQSEIRSLAQTVNSAGKLNTTTIMAIIAAAGLIITIGKLWTDPTNKKLDTHIRLTESNQLRTTERLDREDEQVQQLRIDMAAVQASVKNDRDEQLISVLTEISERLDHADIKQVND